MLEVRGCAVCVLAWEVMAGGRRRGVCAEVEERAAEGERRRMRVEKKTQNTPGLT